MYFRGFRLPPRFSWGFRSSGMLRSEDLELVKKPDANMRCLAFRKSESHIRISVNEQNFIHKFVKPVWNITCSTASDGYLEHFRRATTVICITYSVYNNGRLTRDRLYWVLLQSRMVMELRLERTERRTEGEMEIETETE
jgi:hypothetical protein